MTRSPAAPRPRGQLDLAHSTAHWIKAAHRALQQSLQARLEPFGIKLSHWHCLRYLWEEDGLTQRELSRRVDVKESTLVALIREMETLGLIRRVRDQHDLAEVHGFASRARCVTCQLPPVAGTVNRPALPASPAEIEPSRTDAARHRELEVGADPNVRHSAGTGRPIQPARLSRRNARRPDCGAS